MKNIYAPITLSSLTLQSDESLTINLQRYWKGAVEVKLSVGGPLVQDKGCPMYIDTCIEIKNIQTGEIQKLIFEDKKE
jgi:hypothetical protein